jgi:hypothetical protein
MRTAAMIFALMLSACATSNKTETQTSSSATSQAELSIEDSLLQVAKQMQGQCPMQIDDETELTSVQAQGRVFVYHYQLSKLAATDLNTQAFADKQRQTLVHSLCNNPDTFAGMLQRGVTMRYSYADKNRAPLTSIDVILADCSPRSDVETN